MPAAHSPAADSSTTTARPVTDGTVPQAGTVLTHPVHGPVRVLSVRSRRVRGTATRYVELRVIGQSMRIAIPLGHSEDVGLRDLLAEDQIEDVLDQLAQPSPPAPARKETWARRMKQLQMRAQSRSLTERVGVVRQILRESGEVPKSLAERQLLHSALAPLAAEISIARGISVDEAHGLMVDAALPEHAQAA